MTSGTYPLVSVVTPVYNGERYLRECIESVLAQTYTNWDYTIVNNCSEDRTREIAEEYAARDARIRVHNNTQFVRVIANHNVAVRQISPNSKYCKIVAADDWLFPDCLFSMVHLAETNPTVAIVGAYALSDTIVILGGLPYPSTVVSGHEICRQRLLGGPFRFGTPTSSLFRSDIVRAGSPFFNESNLHADMECFLQVLRDRDYGFVHQVLTFNRTRPESLTAVSASLNTYLPGFLYHLLRYGPIYLTREELEQRVTVHLRKYYRFLGESVFARREREFWTFHKSKLRDLGCPLSYARLGAVVVMRLLDLLLNPKWAVEVLWRKGARLLGGERANGNQTGARGMITISGPDGPVPNR